MTKDNMPDKEIFLFPLDGEIVWCDSDESHEDDTATSYTLTSTVIDTPFAIATAYDCGYQAGLNDKRDSLIERVEGLRRKDVYGYEQSIPVHNQAIDDVIEIINKELT